eukprot:COSAG06_NODE_12202_length_1410_cov_1.606407_2_plen_263_part_00
MIRLLGPAKHARAAGWLAFCQGTALAAAVCAPAKRQDRKWVCPRLTAAGRRQGGPRQQVSAKCPVSGLAQAILRVQQRRGVVERAAELGTAACRSCFYSSTMDLLSHAASGYVQRQIHDPEELLRERERRKENGYAEAQAIDNPVAQEDGTTFEQEERGVRDGGASGHHVAKKTRLDGLPVWFPPKDKHGKWVITQSKAAHAVSSFPGMYRKNGDWNKYIETLKDNRTKDRAAMEDLTGGIRPYAPCHTQYDTWSEGIPCGK